MISSEKNTLTRTKLCKDILAPNDFLAHKIKSLFFTDSECSKPIDDAHCI